MFNKPTRNHFSIIFEQLGAFGLVVLGGGFSFIYELFAELDGDFSRLFKKEEWVSDGADAIVILLVLAAAAVLFGRLVIHWYKTFFYFENGYLVCERKTLMKKSSRLPFSAVATVNLERNVFERIIGTAKIKLDINSSVTADKTDFTFVLPLKKAEAFERVLVEFKGKAALSEEEKPARNTVCAFTGFQAVRHMFFSLPVVQLLITGGLLAASVLAENRTAEFSDIAAAFGFVALAWVFGAAVKTLSFFRFCVECDEKSIYISSGLLKKKQYSFERSKINAVVVRRPLLARLAGLYSAEVAVVGFGNDKEETPQISLLVKKQELERILAACAPDFVCASKANKSCLPGLLSDLFRPVFLCMAAAVPLGIFVHWGLSLAAVLSGIVFGLLSHKSKSIAYDDKIFSYSKGVLSRRTGYFKYKDIQTASFCTNAVLNRFGIGRIKISVLSSSAMSRHTTGWFEKSHFDMLLQKI